MIIMHPPSSEFPVTPREYDTASSRQSNQLCYEDYDRRQSIKVIGD